MWILTGRVVRDTHGLGTVPLPMVLIESSNIGMTQVGWKMGIPTLYEGITKFGFGKRTGVELPGDQGGIVKNLSQWNKGTMTSASFGSEVAATPLQLLRACTARSPMACYLVTPRVINAVEDVPGQGGTPWTRACPHTGGTADHQRTADGADDAGDSETGDRRSARHRTYCRQQDVRHVRQDGDGTRGGGVAWERGAWVWGQ